MKVFRNAIAIILISVCISVPGYFPSFVQAEEMVDNENMGDPIDPEPTKEGVVPLAATSGETTDEPGPGLKVSLPEAMQFTGASSYRYPIEVPPGRAGLAPQIALTYNSQMRNGWLGVGWSLDMGSIQRNTKYGLSYTNNDQPGAFVASINGSTAELVPRSDWGTGMWGAEVEGSFSKYYFDSANNYWIVTSKDGTKYYYGYRSEAYSRQTFPSGTFKWYLDRVEDVNGNFMTLSYWKDNSPVDYGEVYLNRIDYTGNINSPALTTTNYVTFGLDNRSDKPDTYTANNRVQTRYRLSTINTYANGQPVRTYAIVYGISPDIFRSRISTITPGSGSSTLPPVSFTYHGTDDPFNSSTTWPSQTHYQTNSFNWVCDIDGDGKQDIVTWNNSTSIKINFGGNNGFTTQTWSGTFKQLNGKPIIFVGDFDGDGACDVATRENGSNLRIHFGNKQRGQFKDNVLWPAELDTQWKNWVGDFNGDGNADLMSWDDGAGSNGTLVRMHISNGAGFQISNWFTDFHKSATYGVMIWLGDFNGDGMTDVMAWDEDNPDTMVLMHISDGTKFLKDVVNPNEFPRWDVNFYKTATQGVMIRLGDFNGDGKTDVMAYDETNPEEQAIMHFSDGAKFVYTIIGGVKVFPSWAATLPKNMWGQMYWAGDFNGDGMTDIISRNDSDFCTMQYSTGSSFDRKINWPCDLRNNVDYGPQYLFGDFNGDGRMDIITRINSTQAEAHYYSTYYPTDVMATAANGIGGTSTIAYLASSERPNPGNLSFVVPTVDRITVNDGNGISSMTDYDYQGGYYVHADREFYGFSKVTLTDPSNIRAKVETTFKQRDTTGGFAPNRYKGLMDTQKVFYPDGSGNVFTTTFITYTTTSAGVASFPHLDQRDDYLCDGTTEQGPCRMTRTNLAYDSYGNVSSKKIKQCLSSNCSTFADERYEFTEYTLSGQPCNATKWIVNKPFTTYITDSDETIKLARTSFEYDNGTCNKGNLTKKTLWSDTVPNPTNDPTTNYQYDTYGRLTKVYDPKGNSVTTTYETTANTFPATETINGLNFITATTYNYRCSKPATKTDPNIVTTTYLYDTFCRPSKVFRPPGDSETYPTQSYAYPALTDYGIMGTQRVTTYVKAPSVANANHTLFKETYFDGLGRTIKTRRTGPPEESPIITTTQYNAQGLAWKKSLPYFESAGVPAAYTTFHYDPVGRTDIITNTDTGVITLDYYQGRTEAIDPLHHTKAKTTDIHGRLIKVEEYTGQNPYALYATTDYFYDTLGNLVEVHDGAKVNGQDRPNITTMVYDSLSRKIRMTDPDMCHSQNPSTCYWEYRYDKNGNLTFQKDAKGQIIMFSYNNDPLNRIMVKDYRVTEGDPVTQPTYETDVVYTYDTGTNGKGRLRSVTDRSGSKTYTYDQRGRATQTVTTIDSTQYTVSNAYDSADRVTSITYPNGSVVAYGYDDGGSLYTVTQDGASRATYTYYNEVGKPEQVNYGNGKITTYTYEPLTFRVHSIITPGLQNLTYAYDLGGNVSSITDVINSSRSQTFTYDHLNRLITATSNGYGTLDYAYNEIGNMTLNDRVGTYTYPQGVVGQPYGPAHPHAVSTAGGASYAYDHNGNLSSGNGRTLTWYYDNKPRTITSGGSTVTYVYDYAGQRAKKTVGSTTTRYIGKLYECAGSTCTTYIFGGNTRIAKKVGTTLTYYHQDHLGSTAAMSNASGASAGDYVYYPYGETFYASGSEKYRFTDQELDNEHGLYNYNARNYDPVLGRFISPDSIVQDFSDPQTLNRYSYCRNNPVMYVDPSGHIFLIDDILIGALIGAVIGAGTSAATGGDIAMGALTGAIGGAFFGAAGGIIQGLQNGAITGVCQIVLPTMQAGMHAAAGTMSGGINAAITGGISGGMGKYFGNYLPDNFPSQLAGRSLIGGVTGGISAAMYGGDFGQGFGQGAWTAALGFICNDQVHRQGSFLNEWWNGSAMPWLKTTFNGVYGDANIMVGLGGTGILVNAEGRMYQYWCGGLAGGASTTAGGSEFTPGEWFAAFQVSAVGPIAPTVQGGWGSQSGFFSESGVSYGWAWGFTVCHINKDPVNP
jgi:RHS repeat-associated protein